SQQKLGFSWPWKEATETGTRAFSGIRIMFGAIWLFDGLLKWNLFALGQMQGVVDGFGINYLSANWVLIGTLVGLGETFGGLGMMLGIFPRLAAAWSAVLAGLIWAYNGFGGWGQPGYTDLGGDLMLGLIFVGLIFAPYAYSLASHWKIRERLAGPGAGRQLLRALLT
ncbi:MAG TPA: DoxX family protein, partial [Thermoplasmata archaeon]|nr:DoxX family protein [Thermoplasmata archaeon]